MKKLLSFVLVLSLALSLVFSLAVPAVAQDAEQDEPTFYDDEIWSLMDDFKKVDGIGWYFSEVVGPSLWGTPSEKRIAYEVADILRSYGIEDVQTMELPRNINGSGSANSQPELIIHDYTDERAADFGYPITFDKGVAVGRGSTDNASTRTGPEGVTGTIVYAGDGLVAADFPPATTGNVALIERGTKSNNEIVSSYNLAIAAGAKLVLFVVPEPDISTRSGVHILQEPGFEATGPMTGWPTAGSAGTASWSTVAIANATTPYAFVPDFVGGFLREEPNTDVTYRMQSYNTFHQTVATIPGPSEDSEIIVFTCHIDTVTGSSGANDNRTGMLANLELARVYQQLAEQGKLDKEIVFVICGAEETGLVGSTAVANARPGTGFTEERVSRMIACYNFDMSAPADPWNAGMTMSLRQSYGGSNPPIDDIVSINSIAAAQRLGMPVIPIAERNTTGKFAIKLTNGGGSDHAPFGAKGIPNANHSVRGTLNYPAVSGDPTTAAWNGTVPLESRYHTAGDLYWYNYSPERMEMAIKLAGASSYAIARTESLLRVSAPYVTEDDVISLDGRFSDVRDSNVAIATFTWDPDVFDYVSYRQPEEPTTLVTWEPKDLDTVNGKLTVVLMNDDYAMQDLGAVILKTKAGIENGSTTAALTVGYVSFGEDEEKIELAKADSKTIRTVDGSDWEIDATLVGLSNLIDCFGDTTSSAGWYDNAVKYDFNKNGIIDISDIAHLASLIV